MLFVWILASAFPAQPGRWLIAGMTVGVGIALAVVIHKVNRSALGEFGRAMDMVNGQASAQLVMASGDFSDQVFDDIVSRQHDLGIQAVNPVLASRHLPCAFWAWTSFRRRGSQRHSCRLWREMIGSNCLQTMRFSSPRQH